MTRLSLVLTALLSMGAAVRALAADPTGTWLTQDGEAKVRIEACGEAICGRIVWLKEPLNEAGEAKLDRNNPEAGLRGQPILGLPIIQGMLPDGPTSWDRGRIYSPRDGRSYRATMRLPRIDLLEVGGCVLVFCDSQAWTRAE